MIHDALVCRELVELVTDWLEGALPEPRRAEVEEHLAICPGCVAYVDQMRATTRVLRQVDREPVPGETRQQLLDAFRAWRDR
jgi:anti-sigma factor RsiW